MFKMNLSHIGGAAIERVTLAVSESPTSFPKHWAMHMYMAASILFPLMGINRDLNKQNRGIHCAMLVECCYTFRDFWYNSSAVH